MRAKKVQRKRDIALSKSKKAVKNGSSYRDPAQTHRVAKSTLRDAVNRPSDQKPCLTKYKLGEDEESAIVQLALRCADRGVPVNRRHLAELACIVIRNMTDERKKKLPFRNGRPRKSEFVLFTSATARSYNFRFQLHRKSGSQTYECPSS